jgi:hypothetical protein
MKKYPMIAGLDEYLKRKRRPDMKAYAEKYASSKTGGPELIQPAWTNLSLQEARRIEDDIDAILSSNRGAKAEPKHQPVIFINLLGEAGVPAKDLTEARLKLQAALQHLVDKGLLHSFSLEV